VTVLAYAEDMRHGRWNRNGSVIGFDRFGALRDGHHRLSAVVKSQVTVVMDVVLGLESRSLMSIDCGRGRRLTDFLQMPGAPAVSRPKKRSAYLSTCIQLLTGQRVPVRTLDSYERWMIQFGEGVGWAADEINGNRAIEVAPVAGALAFAFNTDPDGIMLFADQLCSGERLQAGDPAHTLRRMILEGRGRLGNDTSFATSRKVLNAARAALSGRTLSKVYDTVDGLHHFRRTHLQTDVAHDLSKAWIKPDPARQP
jgi:hypothetical protein